MLKEKATGELSDKQLAYIVHCVHSVEGQLATVKLEARVAWTQRGWHGGGRSAHVRRSALFKT
jgi:hypothetical protein